LLASSCIFVPSKPKTPVYRYGYDTASRVFHPSSFIITSSITASSQEMGIDRYSTNSNLSSPPPSFIVLLIILIPFPMLIPILALAPATEVMSTKRTKQRPTESSQARKYQIANCATSKSAYECIRRITIMSLARLRTHISRAGVRS